MTKKITVAYKPFDVVVVPFPFADSKTLKRRPALILSSHESFDKHVGCSVMAMITSARNNPWPLDVGILDLKSSGLPKPSVIRMKFFTLDHRLILDKLGTLSAKDQKMLCGSMKLVFKEVFGKSKKS